MNPIQHALNLSARPRYVRNSDTSRAAQANAEPKAGTKRMRPTESLITRARVLELLNYDPETGILTRRKKTGRNTVVGSVVGWTMPRGYVCLSLDGERHLAHRLIWLMHYGEWPRHYIDHINSDRGDNRISNLRDVTQFVNMQNLRGPNVLNKIGLLGVTKKRKRFRAQIRSNGRYMTLGTFDTPEQAHEAYLRAKRELHEGCTI